MLCYAILYMLGLSSVCCVWIPLRFRVWLSYYKYTHGFGHACMFREGKWDNWVEALKYCANLRWKHPNREWERLIRHASRRTLFFSWFDTRISFEDNELAQFKSSYLRWIDHKHVGRGVQVFGLLDGWEITFACNDSLPLSHSKLESSKWQCKQVRGSG